MLFITQENWRYVVIYNHYPIITFVLIDEQMVLFL